MLLSAILRMLPNMIATLSILRFETTSLPQHSSPGRAASMCTVS